MGPPSIADTTDEPVKNKLYVSSVSRAVVSFLISNFCFSIKNSGIFSFVPFTESAGNLTVPLTLKPDTLTVEGCLPGSK